MAYSCTNSPLPWDSLGDARLWAEARRAAGLDHVQKAVDGHDGVPDIMDDGLICLMFDD